MVRLKIVKLSSGPFFRCFPRKWYDLKLSNLQWPTLSMFPSQMVHFKIVEPSSGPLFTCFPRKWYTLKLSNPQVAHFFHILVVKSTEHTVEF